MTRKLQTPVSLGIALKNSAIIFLCGFVFFGVGALFLSGAGQISILTCERVETTQINCILDRNLLGVIPLGEEPVFGLHEAEVTTSCREDDDDGGTSCVYSVNLITSQGVVSLGSQISSGEYDSKVRTVRQINNSINNLETPSFSTQYDDIGIQLMPIAIFLLVGLGIIFFGFYSLYAQMTEETATR